MYSPVIGYGMVIDGNTTYPHRIAAVYTPNNCLISEIAGLISSQIQQKPDKKNTSAPFTKHLGVSKK